MLAVDSSPFTKFLLVRQRSEEICKPLEAEDHVVQPIVDVSPPKWHLGHTTWFFEAFILQPLKSDYQVYDDTYAFVFNSYYEGKGARIIRTNRGNLTRPTVDEVLDYRHYVDEQMAALLEADPGPELLKLLALGLNHEQQHQELLLYDIKYILGTNPLFPAYREFRSYELQTSPEMKWLDIDEGLHMIGHENEGFSFDNEHGRHQVFLHGARIADRLVTNGEYLQFMADGGYTNYRHWLSDGWDWVNANQVRAPFHWHITDEGWMNYSLNGGLLPVDMNAPVQHVNYFEADAFAKWAGYRLPTEFEWEVACRSHGDAGVGNFFESNYLQTMVVGQSGHQFYGDVWEWTSSAYLPYPYYKAPEGAVGEYNGKFMVNQMVLRGGSYATPGDHIRATYRNFFQPQHRWLFSGVRLAAYQ
ncbi:ergothioneine biosynthesis protein EgtB [Fulvivirga sedimenti]|uniref:Ergothioneine biosynthesis protein EgtB n=1 Tax=Fulvivirga sedimenti TaxID=2879465 RepID=A0A9X1KW39_9BACT|nr:ergothioneine biosynthesis protein EgtB [Fulvivirga sedimenti]MCA6075498.1 ergothioneine biosynthesis protein EgtB [Fulvivirga sedimenti]MCA6076675.1 ergothioneine biosynthesis protein EgtB [Fulvivirga sedimenti]MCA6077803.1 ergothioneine biosynthesis protein EgtB [Fulvivirga sedimenti]